MPENKQNTSVDPSHGGKLVKKQITDSKGRKETKWVKASQDDNKSKVDGNKDQQENTKNQGSQEIDHSQFAKTASTNALKRAYKESKDKSIKEAAKAELSNRGVDVDEVETNYISFENKDNFYCDMFFDQYKSQAESLSSSDIKIIDKYRGDDGWNINNSLREGKNPDSFILNLDNLFNNFHATHSFETKRSISSTKDVRDFFRGLNPGDVYEDKAYVSTTISDSGLKKFEEKNTFYITIKVRKGQRLLPTQILGSKQVQSEYGDEFEFTLPRSSRFRVLKRQENNLTVELL